MSFAWVCCCDVMYVYLFIHGDTNHSFAYKFISITLHMGSNALCTIIVPQHECRLEIVTVASHLSITKHAL